MKDSYRVSDYSSFPWTLFEEICCPCCGSSFECALELGSSSDGLSDAVIRCDCYEYPIVKGIVHLRQVSPVSSTRNEAVECLKRHDPKGALQWLLENGSSKGVPSLRNLHTQSGWRAGLFNGILERFERSIWRQSDGPIPLSKGFEAALRASRPKGYANYLYQRYANPSFLGAIPPLMILGNECRKKHSCRVLDLLCGVGHASAILSTQRPELEIINADSDFVNLFLARHFLVPTGAALCIDAELPLPFKDSSVDGLFCLDGLHYIRSKIALLREVDRIVSADGVWFFVHMHNVIGNNENPGAPLSADGYASRFDFGRQRMMSEAEVLRQFQADGCLDLKPQTEVESLVSGYALTLVGARTETLWEKHSGLDDGLCRRPDLIGFNPLYLVERVSDGLMLRANWPSESFRRECLGKIQVLPETVQVSQHVVEEVAELRATGSLSDDVRKLLRSFVLVCLPECYPRTAFPP